MKTVEIIEIMKIVGKVWILNWEILRGLNIVRMDQVLKRKGIHDIY